MYVVLGGGGWVRWVDGWTRATHTTKHTHTIHCAHNIYIYTSYTDIDYIPRHNTPQGLHEGLPHADGDVRAGAALRHVGQLGKVVLRQAVRGVALCWVV